MDGQFLLASGRDNQGPMRVYSRDAWNWLADPIVQANRSNIEYIDVHDGLMAVTGEDAHMRVDRMVTN